MIGELIENAALLVAMAVVYDLLAQRLLHGSLPYQLAAGGLFGIVALISMSTPVAFAPGIFYDGRSIILCVAGFIGGPASGGVAAVMAGGYRLWIGGAGTLVGVLTIIEAAGLGYLFYRLRMRDTAWERPLRLLLLGLAVHVIQLLMQLLLPGEIWREAVRSIAPVVLTVFPLAVVLIISLFLQGEKKRGTERALRESEERYRSLFHTTRAPMLLLDVESNLIIEANAAALAFYGFHYELLQGMEYSSLSAQPEHESAKLFMEAQERGHHSFELQHISADGSVRTVVAFTSSVEERNRSYIYLVIHDITRLREAEQQLHSLLEEKEVLLREVNHRVKNNLAVMVGLINLQTEEVKSREDALSALSKTRDRILAMSSIHNLLYHSPDVSHICIPEYLRSVIQKLRTVYLHNPAIRLEMDMEELMVDVNRAVPLGLIVSEAITNALKHAFEPGSAGEIRVRLYSRGNRGVLQVQDNGCGFPEERVETGKISLGQQLMRSLSQQIDGTLSIDSGEGGTTVELEFER